jgi:L-fucose dehydrogenase
MDLGLHNKVIILAVGKKRIGAELICVLCGEGAIVVMLGEGLPDNQHLRRELVGAGENVFLIETALEDPGDCKKAIESIHQKYGRVDGLVNDSEENTNGGLGAENNEGFLENIQLNLSRYYLITQYALPYLKISKGPIINISVNAGLDNTQAYAAVDGGINALTREWAVELLKYSIRVNALIVDEKTLGISNAVAFLLSEKSSHTTGQLIRMDREQIIR